MSPPLTDRTAIEEWLDTLDALARSAPERTRLMTPAELDRSARALVAAWVALLISTEERMRLPAHPSTRPPRGRIPPHLRKPAPPAP